MMEAELKLLVTSHDAEALRQHPLLKKYATSKPHEQKMSDTYFDTPDLQIRRCDAGLRVRRVDNNDWVQTLKSGVDGATHGRHEWESRVAGPAPELPVLRHVVEHKSTWGRLLRSPLVENRLMPIFSTQVKRIAWELRLPQGDEVECALEQGNLECNGKKLPISEIELELKSGNPAHLFDFALALQQDIPMQIGILSKADRGYALFVPRTPAAVKATPVTLSKRMTIEQVFQAIALNCMAQIQANEGGVAHARDMESLHQMRVGLRRLRCALDLFQNMLQAPHELRQEIDWLTTQLGAARDWDVLASSTLPTVAAAAPAEARLAELKEAAQAQARDQHEAAAAAVKSSRYTRLMLCLTRWVHGYGWHVTMSPQEQTRLTAQVAKFARTMLMHHQRRLLKRGGQLQGASPEVRHRIRIAAKKIRYATEFFQSLYAAKRVLPYVTALSFLQDELGWLNDAATADRLLKQLQDDQTHLNGSAGFARGYLVSCVNNDDKKMRKLWAQFAPMKLPR